MSALRSPSQQGGELPLRAPRRVVLQSFPAGEHEHDHQARPVLADQHRGDDRHDREDVDAPVAAHQVPDHLPGLDAGDQQCVEAERPTRPVLVARERQGAADERDDECHRDNRIVPRRGTKASHALSTTVRRPGIPAREG